MKDDFKILMGQRISKSRKDRNLSQAELGRRIDATSQQINNWETGLRAVSVLYSRKLSLELGVSIDWLTGGDDKTPMLSGTYFTADNDLLAPFIRIGDKINVDTAIKTVEDDGIFAIKRSNEQVFFRWIKLDEIGKGFTISVSRPAEWESIHVENLNDITIVGRAVSITRRI